MFVTGSLNWGFGLVGQCFIFVKANKKEWKEVCVSWSQIWGKTLTISLKSRRSYWVWSFHFSPYQKTSINSKLRTRLKTKFLTSVKAIFRKYFEVSELNITLLPSSQIFKLVGSTQTKLWTMILTTFSSYLLHFIPSWLENLFIYNRLLSITITVKMTILTKSG